MPKINSEPTIYVPFRCPVSLIKQIELTEPDWNKEGGRSKLLVKILREKYHNPDNYDEKITKLQEEIKHRNSWIQQLEEENEIAGATIGSLITKESEKTKARK